MSCLEVMYQHPYAPYFPAAAAAHYGSRPGGATSATSNPHHHGGPGGHSTSSTMEQLKKLGLSRLGDSQSDSSFSSLRPPRATVTSSQSINSSLIGTGSSGTGHIVIAPKEEQDPDERSGDQPQTPATTQYISSTCVLLTYFTGDTADNVDEHFTRALSQHGNGSSYHGDPGSSPSTSSSGGKSSQTGQWNKDTSPMSSRNFPPSFWNSHYQPPAPSGPATMGGLHSAGGPHQPGDLFSDPYSHMTSSLHHAAAASLQTSVDPWRYPSLAACTSTAQPPGGYPGAHPGTLQDFSHYSTAAMHASSRFNAYTSLLPGSNRLTAGAGPGQCDPLGKHESAWGAGSRYHHPGGTGDALHASASLGSPPHHHDTLHAGITGGIDTGTLQASATKDMYWF